MSVAPPQPPRSSFSPAPPPPRSSSPALSSASRPSTPNFLSQSTRTRPQPTLNLSALLADLSTLDKNPGLLEGEKFRVIKEEDQYAPKEEKRGLDDVRKEGKEALKSSEVEGVTEEWLERMERILGRAEGVLGEKEGEGRKGRMEGLEKWVEGAEEGLRE